ncbi:MAG: gliding motility-associated ABC transporter permease subunit GldF [Bacteroidetes bacterium]|nr:gliding motility-associated ABC transporter permease subunit GldF [Bacteroidota bacterium]HET6243045.1 gliding motility-associated ABC transporter permease subunit GldF [Bacteroidia bacterium]
MRTLYFKEISSFLSSLIGYIVITIFLTVIGLFMWVFPGEFNILDAGYANIDTLFIIAPWVFMFLIPAVTMRMFADEKKSGTIELLLTRPLTDIQIILGKYLAGLTLVILSLLPTLVYYYSAQVLGNPTGNIDTGGMWGSYLGLLFLASAFVSIGIFSSSVTENQIIAFIIGVFLSFFFFIGFESISTLAMFGKIDSVILHFGINEHYISMSRGVIDSRDVIYYLSLIGVFLLLTRTVLESRKW